MLTPQLPRAAPIGRQGQRPQPPPCCSEARAVRGKYWVLREGDVWRKKQDVLWTKREREEEREESERERRERESERERRERKR